MSTVDLFQQKHDDKLSLEEMIFLPYKYVQIKCFRYLTEKAR
jgi:hypothetical protein